MGQQEEETSFFWGGDFRNLGDSCVECLGKRLVLSREMDWSLWEIFWDFD